MENFLENLDIPILSPDDKKRLDKPILQPIVQAISFLQSEKSPGPDAFPVEIS